MIGEGGKKERGIFAGGEFTRFQEGRKRKGGRDVAQLVNQTPMIPNSRV